jgi:nitrogen-specific signal transduction histidine kinase
LQQVVLNLILNAAEAMGSVEGDPNWSAQPLSSRTPQKVNEPGPVAKKAKGESGLWRPKLFELAA